MTTSNHSFQKIVHRPFLLSSSAQTAPQVSRHLFTRGGCPRSYNELEIFRQQIELNQEGLHHQPYTLNKAGVKLYRSIFFGFAIVFACLSLFVTATSSSITYAFFNFSIILKTLMILICALMATASFVMALTMRTERESVMRYARMAKSNACKIYTRKKLKVGLKRFLILVGHPEPEVCALKQMYHETCDKIVERKEEALHLVDRIASNRSLDAESKELLYNQAIAEFNHKLMLLTHNFKHSSPNHLIN